MTVYGLSQSTGVERRLEVQRAGAGVLLIISDHVGPVERDRVIIPPDDLMAAIMDRPEGGSAIEGLVPAHGVRKTLDIEVRGNEVLLRVRAGTGAGWDVAVGLDDFQDALEGVVAAE